MGVFNFSLKVSILAILAMQITSKIVGVRPYRDHHRDGSEFQLEFKKLITADPNLQAKVLDIGCGDSINPALKDIYTVPDQIDGVDTVESVVNHQALSQCWHGPFESVAVPNESYDLALAYNVIEHIENCHEFLFKVSQILKPGGSFWALTSNANHPFTYLSRGIELLQFKQFFADRHTGVNDYPAYYRVNSESQITPVAQKLGFKSIEYYYCPCMNWDGYFPKALKFIPNLYDKLLGIRKRKAMLILMVRLVK